jgi:hypothetical protein
VHLLAPGDPLLLGRDRAALVADAAQRKRAFPAINAPGLVIADGAPAALWRARKQGKALAIAMEPLDGVPAIDPAALRAAAQRLAPHRGATSVTVATA